MKHTQSKLGVLAALALCALATPAPASAADAPAPAAAPATLLEAITGGKPLLNFRLRSEHVNQDKTPSFDDAADAVTLRSLIGWETLPFHGFGATVQLINVKELSDDFNDFGDNRNEPGKLGFPVVADPDFTNVNQLYLDYTGIPDTRLRLGRQSVKLDNVRMVGNVEFRQVMQVFDGIALENESLPHTEVYLAHFERVRRIDTKLYDTRIEMLNLRYKLTPTENLIGYGYWQDQPDTGQRAGAGLGADADLSNRILGVRLDGVHQLGEPWKLPYTVEYAKQDDYQDGDERIDAHYLRLGAGVGYGDWFVRVDRENLSSNDDQYAFQTPLGTNHLFQGWVDKFLTTPKHGIEDTFVTFGGKFRGVNLKGEYHWIGSDEDFAKVGGGMGDSYGSEINLSADYALNKQLSGKLEYGRYREDDERAAGRIRDTRKLWLTVMYNF